MKPKLSIFFLLLLVSIEAESQDNFQIWCKLSPEIRLNIEKTPFEFRWRPVDNTTLPDINIARTDIMAGLTFKHFKFFSYSKFDLLKRSWTGIRVDINTTMLDKKLLINIQERFFWGLNKNSEKHYYLIQYVRYKIVKNIQSGILSYGRWKPEDPFNEGHWFVGPILDFTIPDNFNFMISFDKDIFSYKIYMLFIRLGYKIKIK